MGDGITQLGVAGIAARLAAREVSAVEVAEAYLGEIGGRDSRIGAFLAVDADAVRRQAAAAQARLDAGETGPLLGVPVAVKDNVSTEGLTTTCASRILEGYVPPYDATVVTMLKAAGAVVLGKTNLDEFAMGASTETSAYRKTRNPWDPDRTPGGSSGGSAAAVAAGLAPVALGSDTGGSIRQPAALCGVVGYKPTYGRCSRYGLVAFASSLDQIGPIARTVADAAALASVTTGHDPMDSTSLRHPPVSADVSGGSLRGLRLALPRETFEGASAGVRASVEAALDRLRAEGAVVEEVSLPSIELGVTTYYIIAPAEASSNLARFDGVRYGPRAEAKGGHIGLVEKTRAELFGHEVKTRIMVGTYALSAGYYDAYYLRAQQVRQIMAREFEDAFGRFDLVVSPTSPVTAFRLGELDGDPLAMKLLDRCTIPANMGGFPSISIPCGLSDGLPVGLQFTGPVLGDEAMLRTAAAAEAALEPLPSVPTL